MAHSIRHPHLLNREHTLLVVVDMQEPFLRDIWQRNRVIGNVNLLIRSASIMETPIIPTVQYAQRMGGIVPAVAACLPEGEPLDKMCFSCAGSAEFLNRVRASGKSQIILCGIETHICVCQTALDLVQAGFRVHVVADAVSSRSELTWQLGLRKMEQAEIVIDSTEGAIYELLFESGTPEFKEALKLLKDQ